MVDTALWSFGRASGFVALAALTISVLLGILTRSGHPLPGLPRFSIQLVHRNIALISGVFVVLHVGTLILDPFAKLSVLDAVVPFLGQFKPFWQGLGTVALDLLIAIVVTGLLRRRIGAGVFRFVHWFTYAMWPIAVLHAIGNGTNSGGPMILISIAAAVLIAAAVIWRLGTRFGEAGRLRGGVR